MACMAPVSRLGGRALAGLLPDVQALPGAVYLALAGAITALVLDGRIATETRLPSERDLAAALSLSRATVTAAYDELRAAGYLASRTGSGSYVSVPAGSRPTGSLARWTSNAPATDLIDLSVAAMPAPPGVLEPIIAEAAGRITALSAGDGYDPAGLPELRAAVAERFCARGVPTTPAQILITNGALHGWDLLLRLLVGPGDRVLTELPTYPGALDAIRGNGSRVVPVPLAADGSWHVEQMQATFRQTAPRLAYLTPDYHNPTGALVDEDRRRSVLAVARQTGTTVVVDESFVDLGFVPAERPAAAIDPTVVTLGSLSKPVWGGLRIGWLRAGVDLVHRLAALRATIDMAGPVLDQLVAAALFDQLDQITERRVAEVLPRRDALIAAVHQHLPQWRVTVPQGGLSAWIELDAALSTPLTMLAGQAGVLVVPGSRFGVDGTLERFLRLPYALPADRLGEAVQRLAQVWSTIDRSGLGARQLVVA
jgi:DNA-binding transcriptional MocR family regulator